MNPFCSFLHEKEAMPFRQFVYLILSFTLFWGCTSYDQGDSTIDDLRIRIQEDPDRIHPMLSRTGVATQIERLIFLPLVHTHPVSLRPEPALVQEMPVQTPLADGRVALNFSLRSGARWSDGQPITAADVAFTVKVAFLPGLSNSMRPILSLVDSIAYRSPSSQDFILYLKEPYILGKVATGALQPYPSHYFDPDGLLSDFSLRQIQSMDTLPLSLEAVATRFKDPTFGRDTIIGSGRYTLAQWETNRFVRIKQVPSHWSMDMSDSISAFVAKPEQITYIIIPDEVTAMEQLKNGNIDLLGEVDAIPFKEMSQDSQWREQFEFYRSSTFKQFVILLHNQSEVLQDVAVRKALAYVTDKEAFIEDVLQGMGQISTGPIHPQKPYYKLPDEANSFSIDRASELLTKAGWIDMDGDGIREKIKDGKKLRSEIEILVTGSELSNSIALRLKSNARKAGISIQIQSMPFRNILQRLKEGAYDCTPLSFSTSPFPDDPYQSWHSDNIGPNGSNYVRFANPKADSLIEALRTSMDVSVQKQLYNKWQEIFTQEMPAIFLAAPMDCMISGKAYRLTLSPIKPGYAEHLTSLNTHEAN